ncbi:Vegetative incompatibility protein HET-E-1 [Diplodia seriata]|uniref:Vegetative incompatibility protein HET-E-1 n=1 Tax=Diplodia seriata TaxID=420778 RepID=A0A1S8B6F0_9PEZI|nr:Vegetative incompatibility protein HET-E-1 [Diplodia seriata]
MSDIRTSLPIPTEPWERARSRFLEGLTEEEQANFRSATLETIYYQADVAHRDHQQKSKLHACRQKLRPLLDILEAFGKGLDVISNTGTVSMVMAPLWGSIRVALQVQIAQDSTDMFEKIVDMLTDIGYALPHFRDYERLFPSHERLLVAISEAYLMVIYFCTDIKELLIGSKISLTLACKSSWKPFAKKFDHYLKDFTKLQSRIDKEAHKADMIEAKQERKRQEDRRMALVRLNKKEKLREALRRISPYDYKAHHRRIQEMRHHGTATWLFDCQPFQEWLSAPTSSSFGCFGIPGSGKTILASSVNDHLVATQQPGVICYHYCSYEYPSSLKATAILGTFLRQILEREGHSAAVEESLYEDLQDKLDAPTPGELFSVISNYLKSGGKYFFLIDGVDELPHSEQAELAAVVQKALTDVSGCTVKIFLSCRREAVIDKKVLHPAHSVTISPANLSRDIRSFVEAVVDEKLKEGELKLRDPRLKFEIIDRLVTGAKEMFLWVKFQIDEICEAVSDEGIRETLENLPRDLVSTYARIIHRIETSTGGPTKLEIIGNVFRWLVCAKRPLTIEELKVAVALKPTDTSIPTARIPSDDGSKLVRICSSLVTLSKVDHTVRLAHHTVRQFILLHGSGSVPSNDDPIIYTEAGPISSAYTEYSKTVHFSASDAEWDIGELCLVFLHFDEFETQIQIRNADQTKVQATGEMVNTLLQGIVPSLGILGRSLAYLNGGTSIAVDKSKDVTFVLPKTKQNGTNQKPLFGQYPLLQYISTYWPFHLTRGFPTLVSDQKRRIYRMVKNVAFHKAFLFPARPWDNPKYTEVDLEHQHISQPTHLPLFRWALEHGSDYLWILLTREMTTNLRGYILVEMQPYREERDILVRAASGGSVLILKSLIFDLKVHFQCSAVPVDVLYRAIAVSSSSTAKQLFDIFDIPKKRDIQVALGQPTPERVFFRRRKLERNHSWLESTWFPGDLTKDRKRVFDALLARSMSEGDDELSEKICTSIFHDSNLRVEANFLSHFSCCKFVLDGEIVHEAEGPSISQSFDLQVHDKITAEFRVEGYEVDNDGKHVCVDSNIYNLVSLQPFKQELMKVRMGGESGAALANLTLLWMRAS